MTAYRVHLTYEVSYEVDTDETDDYWWDEHPLPYGTDEQIAEAMAEVDASNSLVDLASCVGVRSALTGTRVERVAK